ncbi:MAG: amino acid adenylation domain-containing protein [Ignavibacteria bacterium]|nr:amino acid adenylation domain-containing protein [Ignavibacteria bacterium]MCU7501433.1 amino acid adenylation domain-containing protein [Ignavibacteria bacterium]MCU7518454.1 amino acid adenylation domain-containing protein [Ignavibacteria bacterium]
MNRSNQQKEIEAIYPLTYLQEGMLYHCIFNSDPELYFEQTTCRLEGPFNVDAFRAAWQEVIRRHAILRTSFLWKNTEQMMQVAFKNVTLPFRLLDWVSFSQEEQQAKLKELLEEDRKNGFRLDSAPLLNITVIKLSETDFQFIFNHHHLIIDAWSQSILLKELFQLYEGFCRSENIRLEIPRPFRDFVMYLRNRKDLESKEYWSKYLKGFQHPASLPFERKNPSGEGTYNHEFTFLSAEFTGRLNEFARSQSVTVSTVIQCAWALLLSRYNEDDDIVFGMTTAGRPPEFEKVESIIGLFINTIPVRVRIRNTETLLDLLQRLNSELLESREHEHSSLVQIHASSELPGEVPLFRSIFVFENVPIEKKITEQIGSLRIMDIGTSSKTNYPLVLVAVPGDKISVGFAYDANLFSAGNVKTVLVHLTNILTSIMLAPEQKVRNLSILSEKEQLALIEGLNPGPHSAYRVNLLHEMFERQAAICPANPAVRFEGVSLSYKELNESSNRLANYLLAEGVQEEDYIALYTDRSPEMITGILGILKSGAAYVPVDPGYPAERISYILRDAGIRFVVTKEELLKKMAEVPENAICLDRDKDLISVFSSLNPGKDISSENAAYIIYTSGSTGMPKGVVVTHFGTRNMLESMKHGWGISSGSRIMQFASIGFDASVPEIFLALTSGAELYIAPKETVSSIEKIAEFITSSGISFATMPPSLLSILPCESIPHDVTIVSAGEACTWDIAQKWSERIRFINAYGPTEVTVCCCYNEYKNSAARDSSLTFPIGRPFENIKLYILDRFQKAVPQGIPGDLYVSSPGLARGYLNRPEWTAERFIPDPFSREAGRRLYKTGDIAKYLPDGNIEFLGRIDGQVKIRGFRIELPEIEAALMSCNKIRNAVVLVKERKSAEKYLAAYLTASSENSMSLMEIRRCLSEKLPDYMIPSEYIFVDAFPITSNGKIDKDKLLKISPEEKPHEDNGSALTHLEELLCIIWAEVLELPHVDINANFFDLGGHSLKAARVISRIRKALGVNVSLKELFNNPTVHLLAGIIQKGTSLAEEDNSGGQIRKSEKRDNGNKQFSLSFSQQRLWFLEQMSPEEGVFNLPLALRLKGKIDHEALRASLSKIMERQESLRTVFIADKGQPFQIIKEAREIDLKYMDFSGMGKSEAEEELKKMASAELSIRFNLSGDLLSRFTLVKITNDEHVLLVIMHHIITDGWSMSIFIRELIHFYGSFNGGQAMPLTELPVQYADYAEWQRGWFSGHVAEEQFEYWKNELSGIKPLLELPLDFPRPQVQTFNGGAEKFFIGRSLEDRLREFCRKESVTPYIALLSAFQILLARLCDTEDVLVGSPVANRTRHETEKIIGFFVNTLVMRANLSGSPGFQDVTRANRKKVLAAFAHQDLPFEQLVEKLQPERNLSYSPIFQAAFVFQNFASAIYELPGLKADLMELESNRTEYDITLTISEDYSGGLTAYLEYNRDLFKKSTALRMIGQFNTLLENLLESPDKSIWEARIMNPEDFSLLMNSSISEKYAIPEDCCVNHVFENVARKHSSQTAVIYSGIHYSKVISHEITYNELNIRANRLANYLKRKGLRPEGNVAVSLPRSIDMIVAVMAVLKSGGVFLPLDPAYPKERLYFMLKDSGTGFLVTTGQIAEEQYPEFNGTLIKTDKEDILIQQEDSENPGSEISPDNLAYIIYTSGSTGRPKGAMLSHKGMCNLSKFQRVFEIEESSRVLQFASSSFDAFIWELIMALLGGAKLCIIPQEVASSVDDIAKMIHETGITAVTLPPSILSRLPEKNELGEDLFSSLRTIIVAGEKIPVELANYWSRRIKFFNAYGPTEATVCASVHHCLEKYEHIVPIGRAVQNYELYVLDKHMNPVSVGTPGELFIGGAGLSRGYINNPALTAERFLPNPFSPIKGERLYRSGDQVRYNENGVLEFIGRIDCQVKIHGLRIETGEIEAVMLEHPGILQAAVTVYDDSSTDGRLVGYLVPRNGEDVSTDTLRKFLRKKLPEYMVPSMMIPLAEFPLTRSGKIDYKALPSAGLESAGRKARYVEPGNDIERKLAEIAGQLLKVDKIGIYDNFFEMGGHSLLITRLISRIRDEFEVDIPLRAIFEYPAISEIARLISGLKAERTSGREKVEKASRGEGTILDLIREIENLPESEARNLLGESE